MAGIGNGPCRSRISLGSRFRQIVCCLIIFGGMTISKRNHRQTRIFLWVFALPTLSLLGAIILAHCNRRDEAKQYQQTVEAIFDQWERDNRGKMVSIGFVEVGQWLANLTLSVGLTPTQMRELEDAIGGFYKCYSQSDFDAFKAYRLRWPFELDTNGLVKLGLFTGAKCGKVTNAST